MKIAFIGHGYHKKTASPRFFLDLISPYCSIDYYWDDTYIDGETVDLDKIAQMGYKKVIIWQMVQFLQITIKYPNIEWYSIPMLDAVMSANDLDFANKKITYISFSKVLHNKLTNLGCTSHYFQYFLNPFDFEANTSKELKGFFWERTDKLTFNNTIEKIVKVKDFDEFNYHNCIDPGSSEINDPKKLKKKYKNITISNWFEDKQSFEEYLSKYTVYFAPRLFEGIGFSFLEAMAMGQCVIAPNNATMNEYIEDGHNGLLYNPDSPKKVDLSMVNSIRKNARDSCIKGYYTWMLEKEKINQIIFDVKEDIFPYNLPSIKSFNKKILSTQLKEKQNKDIAISVITPILNPSHKDLLSTLESVIYQDFENFESIIVDGGSDNEIKELLQDYKEGIDKIITGKDKGPYDAMVKGAKAAKGKWVIYMNAGDIFVSNKILSTVFNNINQLSPDIIYGEHFWLHENKAHLHRALPLNAINGLQDKYSETGLWRSGIPGHQATFTKRELIIKYPYKFKQYNIAADHEFLFRHINSGISFMHLPIPISIYQSGGLSFQNIEKCQKEQHEIYSKYKSSKSKKLEPITFCENFIQFTELEKKQTPSIYIASPIYNSNYKTLKTLDSIISQEGDFTINYQIQNGMSKDNTEEIIYNYFNKRTEISIKCKKIVVSYSNQKDDGLYDAINKAFDHFIILDDSSFMGWLNAGDVFYPHALSVPSKLQHLNKVQWFGQFPRAFDIEKQISMDWKTPFPTEIIRKGLCDINNWPPVQQEGSFWRVDLWNKVNGLNRKFKLAGDWDLWRRFAMHCEYNMTNTPMAIFYIEEGQLSNTNNGEAYNNEIDSIISNAVRKEKITAYINNINNIEFNEIVFSENYYQIQKKKICKNCLPDYWKHKFKLNSKKTEIPCHVKILNEEKIIDINKIITHSNTNITSDEHKMILKIRKSGLFFYSYYLKQINTSIDPIIQFVKTPLDQLKNPNPLFDVSWYLTNYPEVKAAEYNPLYHYIMWGAKAGYNPHPDFSTNGYLAANLDVKESEVNPLLHYLNIGVLENRNLY